MKSRLPQGYGNGGGGAGNIQQLAKQAQKIQARIDEATTELETKEYAAKSGGGAVQVVVSGALEVKAIEILKPEAIDKDDTEMLTDLILVATNEALKSAKDEKEETLESISGGISVPGLF